MLRDFLRLNRSPLIERCNAKAARRSAPSTIDIAELQHGVPRFLDEVIEALRSAQAPEPLSSVRISGRANGGEPVSPTIGETAARHGLELSRQGFPVEEVVYSYGDLCQAITDLALERDMPIQTDEFRTLNHCLDHAIADALRAFMARGAPAAADETARALRERFAFLAHELRNHLHTATITLAAIRAEGAGSGGATAAALDRSMSGMRNLIDQSLADVRATGPSVRCRLIALADLTAQIQTSASLEAKARGCALVVSAVDPRLAVYADPDLLSAALNNLLQNAFKFTRRGTEVRLHVHAAAGRVLIDVEDSCGGLPAGDLETIFRPFTQSGTDRSGIGLGLSICRRNVEANGGALDVRDLPGSGCVFTIDLPQHTLKQLA